jgi:hypothetical protein
MKTYFFSTFTVLLLLLSSSFAWGQRSRRMSSTTAPKSDWVQPAATTTVQATENPTYWAPAPKGYTVDTKYLVASANFKNDFGTNYPISMGNTNGFNVNLTGVLKTCTVNPGFVMWLFSGSDYSGQKVVLAAGVHDIAALGTDFNRPASMMVYEAGEIVLFSGDNFQGTAYKCNAKGLSQTLSAVPADFPTEVGSYANFGSTAGLFKSGNSSLWSADFGIVVPEKRTLTESQTTNFRNKAFVNWVKM